MNNNYVDATLGAYAIINARQIQGLLGQAPDVAAGVSEVGGPDTA
jgi:hypothetical protein